MTTQTPNDNPSLTITGSVELFPGKGGWHYVRLSPKDVAELRKMTGKKGNIPLVITLDESVWHSTMMSMGQQQWFVAIKADVRASQKIEANDTITLTICPDMDKIL
jgi:hypothetical protein